MHNESDIQFPLDRLLARLQRQGFVLTPDVRVRLLRALQALGQSLWDDPQRLKYLLAPLLAQNEKQQSAFYASFDEWLKYDIQVEQRAAATDSGQEIVRRLRRKWILPMLVATGAILFALAAWFYAYDKGQKEAPQPGAYFSLSSACIAQGEPVAFTNQSSDLPKDSLLYSLHWDFGDGYGDSLQRSPIHVYNRPGSYSVSLHLQMGDKDSVYTREIYVHDGPRPKAQFRVDSSGNLFTFTPDTLNANWVYRWDFGNGDTLRAGPGPQRRNLAAGTRHFISLRVQIPGDIRSYCDALHTEILDLRQELVALPAVAPKRYADLYGKRSWRALAWLLGPLLSLMVLAAYEARRRYRRRPSLQLAAAVQPREGPPLRLPFPEQKDLMAEHEDFFTLALALRGREDSPRSELDLPSTLKATVEGAGFPDFRYRRLSRPIEYLALIEQEGPDDQQAQLFGQFVRLLQVEQVAIDPWYYQGDPAYCFNEAHPEGLPLSRMYQLFPAHRLMIFGKGEGLLDPRNNRLAARLLENLQLWEERALLSPLPPADWGRREQVLREHFIVLPADLAGQLDLLDAWREAETPDFRTLQRRLLRERPYEPALGDYDFYSASELEAYLGPERLRWLAATALYPRPVWEITLYLGARLLEDAERFFPDSPAERRSLVFEDLLLFTRIPWLQRGELPEALRAELAERLGPEEERRARQYLKELLEQAQVVPESWAAQEREVQLAIQRALLEPGQGASQASLQLLWEQGLLDPLLRGRLAAQKAAEANREQRRRGLFYGAAALFSLLASLLLWQLPPAAQAPAALALQTLDSAAWYVNAAAEALEARDTLSAAGALRQAARLRPDDSLYRHNASLRNYLRGRLHYETYGWGLASYFFHSSRKAADDSLRQHSLHALGLIFYYLGRETPGLLDSARAYRDQLPGEYFREPPHLLSLLGGVELEQEKRRRMREADSLYRYALQVPQDPADSLRAALRKAERAYDRYLGLDPGNGIAQKSKQAIKNRLATLLDYYLIAGTVVGDPGRSQAGFEVRSWQGTVITDEAGRFTLRETPRNLGDSRLDLLVLREGYETQTVYVDLPPREPLKVVLKALQRTFNITLTLQGSVIDSLRGTPIPGVRIAGEGKVVLSDEKGYYQFSATVPESQARIELRLDKEGYRSRTEYINTRQAPDYLDLQLSATSSDDRNIQAIISQIERNMVNVPGGEFLMGADPKDKDADDDEKPRHRVRLSDYGIGRYEVTNEEYAAFLRDYGSDKVKSGEYSGETLIYAYEKFGLVKTGETWAPAPGKEKHPVVYVTWYGAYTFCSWLSQKTGKTYRLPSEAEWEYAARGGPKSGGYTYAGSNKLDEVAWYSGNSGSQTHPIGGKRPNELGLYDMSGNVWEWCGDWYGDTYYAESAKLGTVLDPLGPDRGSVRVIRGGSWINDALICRVSYRNWYDPSIRFNDLGFRLARP